MHSKVNNMAQETQHAQPLPGNELARAAQEAATTGRRQRVPFAQGYVSVSFLRTEPRKLHARRARRLTRRSSLWSVVGSIDEPTGPTDISANKHQYLTEASSDDTP